ncbi:MAG TPA: maleylpyruvate isomerase N-terminal domain-containing protein [Pseudonocardiaceae bacterium]|jgi:uncharacterized protein (TIGR03083 family)|nr:maleylpyruvate isomerase N-terminal domain-containing protein [Pseudonocardiaceae bacterium]
MPIEHRLAQSAYLEALGALVEGVVGLDDSDMLATSRCYGWNVGDVLVHVHLGLQEMVLALGVWTDEEPDTDAAAYWRAFPPSPEITPAQIDDIQFVRRTNAAYRRPADLPRHFAVTAAGLADRVTALPEVVTPFQGKIMASGDFLAIWAVELVIHHLDLQAELAITSPSAAALLLARQTIEALIGGPLPSHLDDETVVLAGAGRVPLDQAQVRAAGSLAARLPVLG